MLFFYNKSTITKKEENLVRHFQEMIKSKYTCKKK